MGFDSTVDKSSDIDKDNLVQHVLPEDLIKFGLIPELVGRLPILAPLHSLDAEALKNILSEPKNAIIKQYKKLFMMEGVELAFEDAAIDIVVDKAIVRKTGARALRSIVESILLDIMYELPGIENIDKCLITKNTVEKGEKPLYIESDRKAG
jgi:ATP-dependent Clp protease ATP-binding subunit ClpX